MSIQTRLRLLIAGVCIILTVGVFATVHHMKGILERYLNAAGLEAVRQSAFAVGQYFERLKTLAQATSDISAEYWMEGRARTDDALEPAMARLFDGQKDRGVIDVYFAFEHDGGFADGTHWNEPSEYDPRSRDWYRTAKQSRTSVMPLPYIDAEFGTLVLSVVSPAYASSGDLIGVAGVDVNLAPLRDLVLTRKIFGYGQGYLLNNDGTIIVGPDGVAPLASNITVPSDVFSRDMAGVGKSIVLRQAGFEDWTSARGRERVFFYPTTEGMILALAFPLERVGILIWNLSFQILLYGSLLLLLILFIMIPVFRNLNSSLLGLVRASSDVRRNLVAGGGFENLERTALTLQDLSINVQEAAEKSTLREFREALGAVGDALSVISRQQEEITAFSQETIAMNDILTESNDQLTKREFIWSRVLEVSRTVIDASDFSTGLGSIAAAIREVSGAFGVMVARRENNILRVLATSGYRDSDYSALRLSLHERPTVVERAFRQRRPLWIEDVAEDPDYYELHPLVGAEVEIPLLHSGEEVGTLEVAFDEPTPFNPALMETLTPIASALAGFLHAEKASRDILNSYKYLAERLLTITGIYHDETAAHLERIGAYCKMLAAKAGKSLEDQERIALFSRLHDIGKVRVPLRVLSKPGPLSPEEFDIVRKHTSWGAEILGDAEWLAMARRICLTHHEKWDGSGYPHGLRKEEIPWEGQLTALADIYDALRSPRVYKPALPHQEALRIILQGDDRVKPQHFDPRLLELFRAHHGDMEAIYDMLRDH